MRFYKHGKTKAEIDHDVEKAREFGMKFDTAPEPQAPWKRELKKLSDVMLGETHKPESVYREFWPVGPGLRSQDEDPQFQPRP